MTSYHHVPSQSVAKLDARIIKTLQSIRTAFFELLEQKNYDYITVQDILDQAHINRTTFYKYYNNKNELALKMVAEVKQDFLVPLLDKCFSVAWGEFCTQMIPLFERNRQQLRLLWAVETPLVHLRQDFYEMLKKKYQAAHQDHARWNQQDLDYQSHIYAAFSTANIGYMLEHSDNLDSTQIRENLTYVFNVVLK